MKTPMQEMIDEMNKILREEKECFILDLRDKARELLQKEKDVMCDFVEYCDEANRNYQDTEESWCEDLTIDDMFDKRFNTKEK
jgi:hypothetical protein